MPRKPRGEIKTNYFHIMVQGINKSYIFENNSDKEMYIKIINKMCQKYNIDMLSYCIMDNHSHLLVYTPKIEAMSQFMKSNNLSYSIYYNKKYDRVGYVFRDRYKSQGIFSERQLYNCVRYILYNPVKANICCRPNEYDYSYCKQEFDYIYRQEEQNSFEEEIFIDVEEDMKDDKQIMREYISHFNLNIKDNVDDMIRLIKYLREINIPNNRISTVTGISLYMVRKLIENV